jgi:hypothetical protein
MGLSDPGHPFVVLILVKTLPSQFGEIAQVGPNPRQSLEKTMPSPDRRHAVLYYSRDGRTDRLAQRLGAALPADLFRIGVRRHYGGPLGYAVAGFDSLTGRLPEIAPVPDLSGYATLSLGSPIWTSYPATPLAAFLAGGPALPKTVGMFFTSGDTASPDKAFARVRSKIGRPFTATMFLPNAIEEKPEAEQRLREYLAAIKSAAQGVVLA